MTIHYSCIAHGATILCSYNDGPGNYEDVVESMLPNISTTINTKTTYTSHAAQFHTLVSDGIVYICAADAEAGKRMPYSFLAEIETKFLESSLLKRSVNAESHEFDTMFSRVLAVEMDRYSSGQGGDGQLQVLQGQVEGVRNIMSSNIEKVLDRGERIEDLMEKSTDLEANAEAFKVTSRKVRRKYWWKNMKMMIILGVVTVVIILIIVLVILFSVGVLPVKSGDSGTTTTTPKP